MSKKTLPILILLAVLAVASCNEAAPLQEYFIGTNVWYAARLGSDGEDGMRERLCAELDSLHALGLDNLRISAVDGEYDGLEYALGQMARRGMKAVIYLNNAWEWSDGFATYLEKAGEGPCKSPSADGYPAYMSDMARFSTSEAAKGLFYEYLRQTVGRFAGNPAVWSWEICNEPRPFSSDAAVQEAFVDFIATSARIIKELDPDARVTTGSEGAWGCEESWELCKRIHQIPEIDYITAHIWPYNWSWVREGNVAEGVDSAIEKTLEYIDGHLRIAAELGKPLVIEEFGYPRDGFLFEKGSATTGRDAYYKAVFGKVVESAREGGLLKGCNFWAWNGTAEPRHTYWQEGDDLCGDPCQEQQGLNGVFCADQSTISLIRSTAACLASIPVVKAPSPKSWLKEDKGSFKLEFEATSGADIRVDIVRDLSYMSPVQDTVYTAVKKARRGRVSFEAPLGPGFYSVCATGCKSFQIGVRPLELESPQDKPEDFSQFWTATLSELAEVPMEVTMTYMPELSNDIRRQYKVEFTSLGGAKAGGMYVEPVAEGKYPAYVEYMGYGADVYPFDPAARPEAVQLLVSVRDQGIFRDTLFRWIDRGLQSKDSFYYKGAFADVVRALDFVCSREKVDTTAVVAMGESQGGAFTWIAGALGGGRLKAIAPAVPFLCDYEHYSQIVWWPMWEVFEQAEKEGISREDLFAMMRYFDVKNFTDMVTCPVYMAFGLQDPTCPPHTNFAGFNNAVNAASKRYFCVPTCGHAMWNEPSWNEEREKFFNQIINNQ